MKSNCALLSLFILSGILAVEIPEDYAKLLSSKLLQELEKRLDERHDKDAEPKCQFKTRHSTIIRTNASLSAGADFLKAPDGLRSQDGCIQACCNIDDCSVAVYQTVDNSCYLFNCHRAGVCKFTDSSRYSTMIIEKRLHTSKEPVNNNKFDETEGEEEEKEESEPTPTTRKITTRPTTVTTTTSTTTSTSTTERTTVTEKHTTKPRKKTKVSLGQKCSEEENICETEHSHCADNFCQCSDGYHPKNGVCRRDCDPNYQWECTNGKASDIGVNCIAKYDTCDGIAQCPDGSDEQDCNVKGQESSGKEDKVPTPTPGNTPDAKPTESEDAGKDKGKINEDDDSGPTEVPKTKGDGSEDNKKNTEASVTPSPSISKADEKDQQTSKVPTTEKNKTDKPSSNQNLSPDSSVDLLTEVTENEEQSMQNVQGPVVALSLGLTVMALLLLFVGCKYRNMRKKLRRGKPLNSNEADYLINGMYL